MLHLLDCTHPLLGGEHCDGPRLPRGSVLPGLLTYICVEGYLVMPIPCLMDNRGDFFGEKGLSVHLFITPMWRLSQETRSPGLNYRISMRSVRLRSKAPAQIRHLPSLLRTGTRCRSRSFSFSQGTLRLFRTSAPLHPTRKLRAPGQRNSQHQAIVAARRRLHDQLQGR